MKRFITALKLFAVTAVVTGIIYPLIITAIAQMSFKDRADGSLIIKNGQLIGSELIAQNFDKDRYFWPRPSAAGYNTLSSGGSNLSATSKQLQDQIMKRKKDLIAANPGRSEKEIPSDLLCASGSGLDPQISLAAALFQADRVMKARKLDFSRKADMIVLINRMTQERDLGLLGEQRVNVLKLNIALDNGFGK